MDSASERGSQAVHRVLRVLLCFTGDEPTLSLTDVADRTGLTLPTAHRMIRALQREGFLVHDPVSGRNGLGPTIMELARVVLQRADRDELVVLAMPHLERLRRITKETVGLHVPMGDSRICVAELVSREPIRTATGVGSMYKLPRGAAGKVLTAWSDERQAIVRQDNLVTGDELAALTGEFEEIRAHGFATSEGETIPGATAVSLPIFGPDGEVRAAINVNGPANRWTRAAMTEHLPALLEEAKQISDQLGVRHPAPASGPATAARRPKAGTPAKGRPGRPKGTPVSATSPA